MLAQSTPWRRSSRRSLTCLIAALRVRQDVTRAHGRSRFIGLGQFFIPKSGSIIGPDTREFYPKLASVPIVRKRRTESASLQRRAGPCAGPGRDIRISIFRLLSRRKDRHLRVPFFARGTPGRSGLKVATTYSTRFAACPLSAHRHRLERLEPPSAAGGVTDRLDLRACNPKSAVLRRASQ